MISTHAASRLLGAVLALVVSAASFTGSAAPVLAWGNGGGDGYGTHDWIVDQALKVLDGRVDGWLNGEIARLASDDPDTIEAANDADRKNDHVYHGEGKRGAAIDRIAYEYDLAFAAHAAGDNDDASYHIGLLSHFYGDILQPFHTNYDAIHRETAHLNYERLVGRETRYPDDAPAWSSSRRTVSTFSNIRTKAIASAAYSRKYYHELYREFAPDQTRLNARVREITGLVMKRAANDLADVIWSLDQGVGQQPLVGSVKVSVKWVGVRSGYPTQAVYVRVRDVNGKPIEGIKVDVAWPTTNGVRHELLYTDENGYQKRHGPVGTSPKLRPLDVVATIRVRDQVKAIHTWWAITPSLASGGKGFRTKVSDATVLTGQIVTVTSVAHDAKGRALPNLLVTWTWDFNGKKVKTSAMTDANGRASSTQLIASTTTRTRVHVTAHTQAASKNRYSYADFKRVD